MPWKRYTVIFKTRRRFEYLIKVANVNVVIWPNSLSDTEHGCLL